MKTISSIIIFFLFLTSCSSIRIISTPEAGKINGSTILFLSQTAGAEYLTRDDMYLQNVNDREYTFWASIGEGEIREMHEKESFKSYIARQALMWTEPEKKDLRTLWEELIPLIEPYNLNLPSEIYLIKTTGKENGFAPHCRGNGIILPIEYLNDVNLKEILVHELYHIFSRNNKKLEEALFNIIGYKKTGELKIPPAIMDLTITNPDAPYNNYYITLNIEGKEENLIPLVISLFPRDKKTIPKSISDGLKLIFLPITPHPEESQINLVKKKIKYYTLSDLENYFNVIGRNTQYVIHPEEIMASNFELLILGKRDVPNPEILNKMKELLK